MPIPVLVIQPDSFSLENCRGALIDAGLVDGADFVCDVGYHTRTIKDQLTRNQPTLFITGSIRDGQQAIQLLAREAKSQDPKLKIWFFSLFAENDPIYDRCIQKRKEGQKDEASAYKALAQAILQHLGR
jgi:hypothetical protein